jgi:hypothetical protein
MHDVMAYLLVAAVSCLSVVEPGASARLRRVAWLTATLGAAWLALQVAFGWRLIDPGPFDIWEWERFRGFSDNANQLALYCAVISLLSLHLADSACRLGEKIAAVICMIVAIFVGRLTMSDAFLAVLVVAGPIFIALKLWRWSMSPERYLSLRSAFAWILVLALPLALAYATPLGASFATELEDSIKGMTKGAAVATPMRLLVCASSCGTGPCVGVSKQACWAWGLARILKSHPLSRSTGGSRRMSQSANSIRSSDPSRISKRTTHSWISLFKAG